MRGGTSVYTSGIYPGHAPMVALAASAMCRRIERLSVLESLDISGHENEKMFRSMGFDLELDDPSAPGLVEASCGSFKDQIGIMAAALGIELDRVAFDADFAAANEDTDLGFITIGAGRIAGYKGSVCGMVGDRSIVECQFVWKLGSNMTPDWPVTDGYLIEIQGDPAVRCTLSPVGEHFDGAVTTAMPVVNAIPFTVAAAPGIVNRGDLPFVRGMHTIR